MDIVNPDIYLRSYFHNWYALLLRPNAYCDMLIRIFTPFLIFQCVFTDFQCVITLLRALSVALIFVWVTFIYFDRIGQQSLDFIL